MVLDTFAGGGAIPLEALRVGAESFASDLNPVAVLLNKVVLEYIPKYGQKLADEVDKWGLWIKKEAERELSEFYPKDEENNTSIVYLWARTVKCEGPSCGAEVPLLRSMWIAKKPDKSIALHFIPNKTKNCVDISILHKTSEGWLSQSDPSLSIDSPDFNGTVQRGNAVCPLCNFTTPVKSVRRQLSERRGGANDARLLSVIYTKPNVQGKFYRIPNNKDFIALKNAENKFKNYTPGIIQTNPNI
jgi:adenine-specific DNA methylase